METPAAAETPATAGTPDAADSPDAGAADAPGPGQADAGRPVVPTSSDLADGLVAVAESFLAGKVAGADDAEVYQVVVHAGADVLAGPPAPAPAGERPAFPRTRAFPRKRRRPRRGCPVTRRTRPAATSRTARRSA